MVVYGLFPTSNHNLYALDDVTLKLFMVFFLHQTTTFMYCVIRFVALFMVFFLHQTTTVCNTRRYALCCLWSFSYIKPQPTYRSAYGFPVVYGLFPTSNHNGWIAAAIGVLLFMVFFLHQTTTASHGDCRWVRLFMVFFLHQTTTIHLRHPYERSCLWSFSYIKPQLCGWYLYFSPRCLWSFSYIKPQPSGFSPIFRSVVYGLFPTSNHNLDKVVVYLEVLFMVFFLHQTTTSMR